VHKSSSTKRMVDSEGASGEHMTSRVFTVQYVCLGHATTSKLLPGRPPDSDSVARHSCRFIYPHSINLNITTTFNLGYNVPYPVNITNSLLMVRSDLVTAAKNRSRRSARFYLSYYGSVPNLTPSKMTKWENEVKLFQASADNRKGS
jgi:hypothetical protein